MILPFFASCYSGPREALRVKFLEGCTQPQFALVAEGMKMWNDACGGSVFQFAPDDEPIGDVRVLCSDEKDFGPLPADRTKIMVAYYMPSEGRLVVPRVETLSDVNRLPVVAAHELGHAAGLEHRNEDDSIMRPIYATALKRPSSRDVDALRKVGFRCDWNG